MICYVCKEDKPGSEFHSAKPRAPRCKPCAIKAARNWYFANKDRKREYDAKRRAEKRHLYREAGERFRKNNPEKTRAAVNARRRRVRRAMPQWADGWMIKEAYHLAQLRTKATGVVHHVDHIVPLRGRDVCGLHVPHNLQVIPAMENIAKSNIMWEGRR